MTRVWQQIGARDVDVFGGITALMLLALAYLLIVAPLLDEIAGATRIRQAVAIEKARSAQHEQQSALIERQIAELRELLRARWSTAPTPEDLSGFLAELTAIAERAGLAVGQVLPGKTTTSSEWTTSQVVVQASGPTSAWVNFMRAVEERRCGASLIDFEVRANAKGVLEIRITWQLTLPSHLARQAVEAAP